MLYCNHSHVSKHAPLHQVRTGLCFEIDNQILSVKPKNLYAMKNKKSNRTCLEKTDASVWSPGKHRTRTVNTMYDFFGFFPFKLNAFYN